MHVAFTANSFGISFGMPERLQKPKGHIGHKYAESAIPKNRTQNPELRTSNLEPTTN